MSLSDATALTPLENPLPQLSGMMIPGGSSGGAGALGGLGGADGLSPQAGALIFESLLKDLGIDLDPGSDGMDNDAQQPFGSALNGAGTGAANGDDAGSDGGFGDDGTAAPSAGLQGSPSQDSGSSDLLTALAALPPDMQLKLLAALASGSDSSSPSSDPSSPSGDMNKAADDGGVTGGAPAAPGASSGQDGQPAAPGQDGPPQVAEAAAPPPSTSGGGTDGNGGGTNGSTSGSTQYVDGAKPGGDNITLNVDNKSGQSEDYAFTNKNDQKFAEADVGAGQEKSIVVPRNDPNLESMRGQKEGSDGSIQPNQELFEGNEDPDGTFSADVSANTPNFDQADSAARSSGTTKIDDGQGKQVGDNTANGTYTFATEDRASGPNNVMDMAEDTSKAFTITTGS